MTRNNKILFGILSFVPLIGMIIGMVLYVSFIFSMMSTTMHNPGQPPAFVDNPAELLSSIIPAIIILAISSIVGLGLFIYFLICAIKDVSATENDKLLWILLLVFMSYLVMPVFWYVRIWSNPDFSMNRRPANLEPHIN